MGAPAERGKMDTHSWFTQLSMRQRFWLFGTIAVIIIILGVGFLSETSAKPKHAGNFSVEMSIRDIASTLNVTGKALARDLTLPLNVSKKQPLNKLGVTPEELQHVTEHLLSHRDSIFKYYIYAVIVLGGLVFLVRLGQPDLSDVKDRGGWYPRTPYIASLMFSVSVPNVISV